VVRGWARVSALGDGAYHCSGRGRRRRVRGAETASILGKKHALKA